MDNRLAGPTVRSRNAVLTAVVGAALTLLPGWTAAQTTQLISESINGPGGGEKSSGSPSISSDGSFLSFLSAGDDIAGGDSNGKQDVFVYDRLADITAIVSKSSSGVVGNGISLSTSMSGNGRYAAFSSGATNLVASDTNGSADIFRHDMLTGQTIRVSLTEFGLQINGNSISPALDESGDIVAFVSLGSNVVASDTNGVADVFVRNIVTGETRRASLSTLGVQADANCGSPVLSGDGRYVAFSSSAITLSPNDTNGALDVFLRDTQTNVTTRLSTTPQGLAGNGPSEQPDISSSGQYVVFESMASDLDPTDGNGDSDIFVYDTLTGMLGRLADSEGGSDPTVASDGTIAFASDVDTLPADSNGASDILVHNLALGTTEIASVSTESVIGDDDSSDPTISEDGRFVSFASAATQLVHPSTDERQVFLRDRASPWLDLGNGLAGVAGVPALQGDGTAEPNTLITVSLTGAAALSPSFLVLGLVIIAAPFKGGVLVPAPDLILAMQSDGFGNLVLPVLWPAGVPSGVSIPMQYWIQDATGPAGFAASNGLSLSAP